MGLDVVQNLTPFGTVKPKHQPGSTPWVSTLQLLARQEGGLQTAVVSQAGASPCCFERVSVISPLLPVWDSLALDGHNRSVRINPPLCVSPAVSLVTVWWNRCSGDGFQITNSRTGGFFTPSICWLVIAFHLNVSKRIYWLGLMLIQGYDSIPSIHLYCRYMWLYVVQPPSIRILFSFYFLLCLKLCSLLLYQDITVLILKRGHS